MSLELKLDALTAAVVALTVVMQSGAAATAIFGEAADRVAPKGKVKKTDTPAAVTRYVHIPAHNTVAAIPAGDPMPSMEGAVEITEAEYNKLKDEQAPKSAAASSPAAATAPAPTNAPAAAGTQTQASGDSTAATPSYARIVERITALSKDARPGRGRDGVKAILEKYKVAKVPGLEALSNKAEILADIEAVLKEDTAP